MPQPIDDETRLSDIKAPSSSPSGWLSSSNAIDHGRFTPGTLLGGRYRIVGQLGRGGMGEVFRADDLKLGQPVALKFLPPDVDRDPARLTQLHTEVRMARQVSHPNVCRVYDIDEQDGNTFLSMEYVDGEDLSSLLKRIGRFPQDRALEIARQICAGLAAAHERGVIHRDLKPANVMLDGTGKVRITDFGLAGASGENMRAGTPAYMAPEQLGGGEITVRSDIYALGLVLYEIFTGQRALDAKNLAELIRMREQSGIVPPTTLVRDLDPEIETAIMRCLRPDPSQRPASALTVSATLPGGDPLAAALAAGETPSPEMVAAAGETGVLTRVAGVSLLAFVLLGLVAVAVVADRVLLVNRVTLPKSADVLEDRAREILSTAGVTGPVGDYARGVGLNTEYMTWAASDRQQSAARWDALANGTVAVLRFWYRTSPRSLMPDSTSWTPLYLDPPLALSGMANVVVDDRGRLLEFMTMPPQVDTSTDPPPTLDWTPMFAAAGFDIGKFAAAPPQWTPRTYGDDRRAWQGTSASDPSIGVRVEATSYRGRPVYFQVVWPWSRPARMDTPSPSARRRAMSFLGTVFVIALLLGAIALARHNLKSGRADQRGARRVTSFLIGVWIVSWLLGARHYFDLGTELDRFFLFAAFAMLNTGFTWLFYLGLEPYVRRLFPDVLISWTRLLSGHVRDARVGRDVLVGLGAGVLFALLWTVAVLIPGITTNPGQLAGSNTGYFLGARHALSVLVRLIPNALQSTMLLTFVYVVIAALVRRRWLATIVTLALCVSVIASESNGLATWASVTIATLTAAIAIFALIRFGLLTISTALLTNMALRNVPLTTDMTRIDAPIAALTLLVLTAAAAYAFYLSRAGEGMLRRLLPA